jgi:hypothetical protein
MSIPQDLKELFKVQNTYGVEFDTASSVKGSNHLQFGLSVFKELPEVVRAKIKRILVRDKYELKVDFKENEEAINDFVRHIITLSFSEKWNKINLLVPAENRKMSVPKIVWSYTNSPRQASTTSTPDNNNPLANVAAISKAINSKFVTVPSVSVVEIRRTMKALKKLRKNLPRPNKDQIDSENLVAEAFKQLGKLPLIAPPPLKGKDAEEVCDEGI